MPHDNVKGKPGPNQPASSSCTPEQKDAGHDSDYADEHDGEYPPIERTFPEMTAVLAIPATTNRQPRIMISEGRSMALRLVTEAHFPRRKRYIDGSWPTFFVA
jgi:hypothetical protein